MMKKIKINSVFVVLFYVFFSLGQDLSLDSEFSRSFPKDSDFSEKSYDLSYQFSHFVLGSPGLFQQDVSHFFLVRLAVPDSKYLFSSVSIRGEYAHPWSWESKTRTLIPERYGWGDVLLSLNRVLSFHEKSRFLIFTNVVFPVSEVSRIQSLRTALALGLSYQREFLGLSWGASSSVRGFLYQYQSVGSFANPILSSTHSWSASYLFKKFLIQSSFSSLLFYDYDRDFYPIPQAELQGSYQGAVWGQNFEIFLSYFWNKDPRSVSLNLTQILALTNGFRFGFSWMIS